MVEVNGDDGTTATVDCSRDVSGAALVRLGGELDLTTAPRVGEIVAPEVQDASEIIFDLSELQFMDSSGIAVLLQLVGTTRRAVVRNPSSVIRRVVESTGIESVLRLEP
jgi:anti-anti-sigma factor